MIEPPRVTEAPAQPVAVIHLAIPKAQIQEAMGPAMGEVLEAVRAQGLTPAGPVFSRHFRMDPDTWDFEVGVPVAAPVAAKGRVKPGELPAARVLQTVYHGGYEGLGAGWGEFMEWIASTDHRVGEGFWERYIAGPESSDDPADWRTELNRPLAG